MHEWKSKRIQHRRLQCNRLIQLFCISSFLFCSLFLCAQAQNTANLPTIKESPIERIHALEISQVNGLSEKSIPEYIELLAFPETQELASYRLATLYANIGNWQKAEIHAKSAIDLNPNNSDFDYLLIRILEKQFQYDGAWKIHKKLIAQQPRFISRYYDAISNCVKRENYSDALQLIKEYQFHFGLNEYAHRIQTQCYLFLDKKYPEQHFLDSLLIRNEEYLITNPKEFTPWVAFHLNQLQKKMGVAQSKEAVVTFYQKMLGLHQHDSTILQELDKLSYEFPVLRNNQTENNLTVSFEKLSRLNKEISNQSVFNDFENQLNDTNISLTELDSLSDVLFKKTDFGYKSEVIILVGNQYFIRGKFEKAYSCYQYWVKNEPSESPFFSELSSPETQKLNSLNPNNSIQKEVNNSVNSSNKLRNDLLTIRNRYLVCVYKLGKSNELKTALEWYEINYPFILDDASQLIQILNLQLNKNWIEAVKLWNDINPRSPILNEVYFAQIDMELNFPNQNPSINSSSFQNQVLQWQNLGKIHPSVARDLIKKINESSSTKKK